MEKITPIEVQNPLDPSDEIWLVIIQDLEEWQELLADKPNYDQE